MEWLLKPSEPKLSGLEFPHNQTKMYSQKKGSKHFISSQFLNKDSDVALSSSYIFSKNCSTMVLKGRVRNLKNMIVTTEFSTSHKMAP